MSKKIAEIEGIGEVLGQKLEMANVVTVEDLLKMGSSREGRMNIASRTGIEEGRILKWVNMADLFRIKGVASEYSQLLEAAGVDTTKELRVRNPENLYQKMEEVNSEKHLVRQTPALKTVTKWVNQAKELEPMITY